MSPSTPPPSSPRPPGPSAPWGAPRGTALPAGEEIASFLSHEQAQHAVDTLAGTGFPVEHLTIVGTDLRQVERITGRMSWGRAALSGAASGLWLGLLLAAMTSLVGSGETGTLLGCVALGVGWGVVLNVTTYAVSRGRRDVTSVSQVVASRYAVLASAYARDAAAELRGLPGNLTPGGAAAARAQERRRAREEARGDQPSAFGSRPGERPRYGVRLAQPGEDGDPRHPGGTAVEEGQDAGAGAAPGTSRPGDGPAPDDDPYLRR